MYSLPLCLKPSAVLQYCSNSVVCLSVLKHQITAEICKYNTYSTSRTSTLVYAACKDICCCCPLTNYSILCLTFYRCCICLRYFLSVPIPSIFCLEMFMSHPLPVLSGRPPSDKAMVMVRAWSARTR